MENLPNIIMDLQWSPKGLEEIVNRIQKDILKERLSLLTKNNQKLTCQINSLIIRETGN